MLFFQLENISFSSSNWMTNDSRCFFSKFLRTVIRDNVQFEWRGIWKHINTPSYFKKSSCLRSKISKFKFYYWNTCMTNKYIFVFYLALKTSVKKNRNKLTELHSIQLCLNNLFFNFVCQRNYRSSGLSISACICSRVFNTFFHLEKVTLSIVQNLHLKKCFFVHNISF